ncbi:DUF4156 domain-containing protein [Arenicella xantha]|uniref:Uncharacterized protein DUF4156 n=1 Tax=Arenicella xantha TaxID=644221 RepID=A0A395JIR7_9GAMM|nr:DUF4156 domain-containing protein [Arenicella xantha]RBP50676.1 uncharacterized protein DUF4156 [Arenicella xantha]
MLRTRSKKLPVLCMTILITSTIVTGCTWVKKTPGAERVRVVPLDRVTDCRNLGSVTAYTKDSVSVLNRSAEKVRQELQTLAMNDAVERQGDTIAATSKIQDGQQTFAIFRCLP